jgi:hypothetical protein
MAGESAREVARRQREKAERLARAAEAWERGADGEAETGRVLAALPSDQWAVFHDVAWPGRPRANIDHVVVGPGGVFVIDSKNWSGEIRVRGDVLRQNGRQRERAVIAAAEASLTVASLGLPAAVGSVVPVLCFVRDEPVTGWARDVLVCSTANVVDMLTSRSVVLDVEVVSRTKRQLEREFRSAGDERSAASAVRARPAASLAPGHTPASSRRPARNRSGRRRSGSSIGSLGKAVLALSIAWVGLRYPDGVTEFVQGLLSRR